MRIALINENSQAAKNAQIEAALKKVVTPMDTKWTTTACTARRARLS